MIFTTGIDIGAYHQSLLSIIDLEQANHNETDSRLKHIDYKLYTSRQ